MGQTRRLRVLVSAYACSPYEGSEPGVGWGFISCLADKFDLWVLVEEIKFRSAIEEYLRNNPEKFTNVRFIFIPKRRNRLFRKIWPPSYYYFYKRWHWDAYLVGRKLHEKVRFDVVHQLTMVGFREPGFLWKLHTPFVWGPVGGMGRFPWRLIFKIAPQASLYYIAYNIINFIHERYLPRPRKAARAAGRGLISATSENYAAALNNWGCKSTVLCEVGSPDLPANPIVRRTAAEPLKLFWAGQCIPRKAMDLLIDALATLPVHINWKLNVAGDGPCRTGWQMKVDQCGLTNKIAFLGWQPRTSTLSAMSECHVVVITSLRDLTSTVTLEALGLGLPIICLDHCGFGDIVDDSCGIKIPVHSRSRIVSRLADAISLLEGNDDLRIHLAHGALAKARQFTWAQKANVIASIYDDCKMQRT